MKSAGYKILFGKRSAVLALLAIGAAGLFPVTSANAQDATIPTKEVNITLNQAPVRTALDTLFKSAGLNYTIDPQVSGLVTVSLRAIPFDVALRSILRSSEPPLQFTIDDGIYDIRPKMSQVEISNPGSGYQQPQTPAATTPAPDESTATQVVPLRLKYANANLILKFALSGTATGYIPSLDVATGSGTGTGTNGSSGTSGMGGMSGMSGMGGMSSGGYGGGMSSGGYGGGMSSGGMSSMGGYGR